MNYWLKRYVDGTEIKAIDSVAQVSWRKTPLKNIVEVEAELNNFKLKISGVGNYWQADTFEAVFPGPKSSLIKRCIQKELTSLDHYFVLTREPRATTVSFNAHLPSQDCNILVRQIDTTLHGSWLILEYDLRSDSFKYYFRSSKI